MLNTFANVLCEIVFACMLYHTEYYRIIVIAYDYECSFAFGEWAWYPPPHPHSHPHTPKRTNEEDLWITMWEKKKKKKKKNGEIKKQVKS